MTNELPRITPSPGDEPEGELELVETDEYQDNDNQSAPLASRLKKTTAGSALAAAMLTVGEFIEPRNTEVTIEAAANLDDPEDDPLANIDFGDLPPLD